MPANRKALGPSTATDAFTLTPHVSAAMPPNRGFIVSVGGTVAIRAMDSSADVSITVVAGVFYEIALLYLRVAGTTATGIVGVN